MGPAKKIVDVRVRGGAPLERVFPRVAGCGEPHVLALAPLPTTAVDEWPPTRTSVTDGSVATIGTGARFAGLVVTARIETVFGVDPIAALVREPLGEPVERPPAMLVEGGRAAASLA